MTKFGKVVAVTFTTGERYYMLLSADKVVSLMPADAVEENPVDTDD
jgi:hypothetical protein